MSAIAHRRARSGMPPGPVPLLHNGDTLSQSEFHRRYLAYPDDTKFELIDGVVFVSSPMSLPQSHQDRELTTLLNLYRSATPGVDSAPNASIILGEKQEPQPDHLLQILPEYGGRTRTTQDEYIEGGPEWIGEVAYGSLSLDLHVKRVVYRRAGVAEYVVVCLDEEIVRWFDLERDRELPIPEDGILKSRTFPGLWIDTRALVELDTDRLLRCLRKGLRSLEHKEFVASLEARRTDPSTGETEPKKKPRRRSRRNGKAWHDRLPVVVPIADSHGLTPGLASPQVDPPTRCDRPVAAAS